MKLQKKKMKEHNLNGAQIPDHLYGILIIRGSRSGKINSLFNLISHQPDIGKIYFYAKGPYKAKYQLLIKKQETTGLKHLNDSKVYIKYSNDMDDMILDMIISYDNDIILYMIIYMIFYMMIWYMIFILIKILMNTI